MNDEIVLEEIRTAKNRVADAESDLARLLSEVQVAPRCEKTTISAVLEDAFQKLRDAREQLGKLETLLENRDDK
jgi:hypothetical protein